MKENATRKMAPGLGPKSSATGTEKIFRALTLKEKLVICATEVACFHVKGVTVTLSVMHLL